MAVFLLIVIALLLPAALLYLTLSVNDFEKNTHALAAVLQRRYHVEPPKKPAPGQTAIPPVAGPNGAAGKTGKP
jgi:hypothetical protein